MQANLLREKISMADGMESIVIVDRLATLPGGVTLDLTDAAFTEDSYAAGWPVIRKNDGTVSLLPLDSSGKFDTSGHKDRIVESDMDEYEYVGVLIHPVTKTDPRAGVLTIGTVRYDAMPHAADSRPYLEKALSKIKFI